MEVGRLGLLGRVKFLNFDLETTTILVIAIVEVSGPP